MRINGFTFTWKLDCMRMKMLDSAKSTLWYQRTSRSFPSLPFAFGKITKSAPFSFIEVNIAVNIQLWGHCVIRSSFLKSQNRGQSGGQPFSRVKTEVNLEVNLSQGSKQGSIWRSTPAVYIGVEVI